MTTEIRVPALGESVTEATVAKWLKNKENFWMSYCEEKLDKKDNA
jgi:hypothetical protein